MVRSTIHAWVGLGWFIILIFAVITVLFQNIQCKYNAALTRLKSPQSIKHYFSYLNNLGVHKWQRYISRFFIYGEYNDTQVIEKWPTRDKQRIWMAKQSFRNMQKLSVEPTNSIGNNITTTTVSYMISFIARMQIGQLQKRWRKGWWQFKFGMLKTSYTAEKSNAEILRAAFIKDSLISLVVCWGVRWQWVGK